MEVPTEIRKLRNGSGMKLTWPGGNVSEFTARQLRLLCQCAACRDEQTGKRLLNEQSVPADITLLKAEIIGTYALGFQFSDGHSTGIYSFEGLRKRA